MACEFTKRFSIACAFFAQKEGEGDDAEYIPKATGFFVEMEAGNQLTSYLVTAKHAVEQFRPGELYLRANTVENVAQNIPIQSEWTIADDADVAVLPAGSIPLLFKLALLPEEIFATHEAAERNHIGVGDEVIVAGLFTKHFGKSRNYPIVRAGIIASIPNDPIEDNKGNSYPGYLIEVRSINGLSGSPVIVMMESHRLPTGRVEHAGRVGFLLGLIRGHWDDPRSVGVGMHETINAGIAIVTPMYDVVKLLKGMT